MYSHFCRLSGQPFPDWGVKAVPESRVGFLRKKPPPREQLSGGNWEQLGTGNSWPYDRTIITEFDIRFAMRACIGT